MNKNLQNREFLFNRHRLSHSQIDRWLGENKSKDFIQEKLKGLNHVRNFISVTDLFRQNEVSFVCIKGPLLSLRLYDDPSVRKSWDLDFLIDKNELESTIDLLLKSGYEFEEGFIWPDEEYRKELIKERNHHVQFFNRKYGFYIELHWTLTENLAVSDREIQKMVAENITTIKSHNKEYRVLDREFELIYLLIHGSRHSWFRLKWLMDIHEYTRQDLDVDLLNAFIQKLKLQRVVCQTNVLLEKYFHTRLPLSYNISIPEFMLSHAEWNINKIEHRVYLTNKEELAEKRYLWLLFPSFRYRRKLLSVWLIRPMDVHEQHLPNKVAYILYRPYSFIKRRLLGI